MNLELNFRVGGRLLRSGPPLGKGGQGREEVTRTHDVLDRPRIDPRIARRWIEARRQEGRRRLRIVIAVAAVAGAAALAFGLLYTPLFDVGHVRASVDGPMSAQQVVGITGLEHHPLMIDVDTGALQARLDSDPWLGAAHVARHWPGTVTLSVVVRTPVALVPAGASTWAELDATGRVLAETQEPPVGLPQIAGAGAVPAAGQWMPGSAGPSAAPGKDALAALDMSAASDAPDVPRGIAAGLAVVSSLPAALRADVGGVTLGPGGTISMSVAPPRSAAGSIAVSLGDGSHLAAKVQALVTFLAQADLSGVTGLDLSVPERPAALTARR